MQLSDFDFPFDPALVAYQPVTPRDHARLLLMQRRSEQLIHRHVSDLPDLLDSGDLLVVNDTKVSPARVAGSKKPTGTSVEVLFVKDLGNHVWEIMVKGSLPVGTVIDFDEHSRATILKRDAEGTHVKMESPVPVAQFLEMHGAMPLPPYIKRSPCRNDRDWYQTVFAKQLGAIAAPTAGLHFTAQLLSQLAERSILVTSITLHVGPATFKPVTATRIEDHRMGKEFFEIGEQAAQAIARAKQTGRRVVAVGTTVVRTLESAARGESVVAPMSGESCLFITPGFRFKVVDALMTNFHLPRTTLLMLVSAFGGLERVRKAYEEAVKERYRFYSYGDAMLIL